MNDSDNKLGPTKIKSNGFGGVQTRVGWATPCVTMLYYSASINHFTSCLSLQIIMQEYFYLNTIFIPHLKLQVHVSANIC